MVGNGHIALTRGFYYVTVQLQQQLNFGTVKFMNLVYDVIVK